MRDIKEEHHFSPIRFICKLENYINCTSDYPEHFTAINVSNTSRTVYGVNAIRKTEELFSKVEGIDYDDFKNLHFLYEHKLSMLRKLKYIENEGCLRCENGKIIEEYAETVRRYTTLRMLALKAMYVLDENRKFEIQQNIKVEINILIDKEVKCLIEVIKNIELTYLPKSLGYLLPENVVVNDICNDKEYAFRKSFNFSWNAEKNITRILIPKHNYIEIIVDDTKTYKLFSRHAEPELNYVYCLNSNAKKIEIRIYSNNEITMDRIPEFYQRDLTYNKMISTSSYFDEENKINLEGLRYWRAAEQSNGYDGSDWIEVNFEKNTLVNTIIIGELDYSPRLRKYRILYCDNCGEYHELLVHDFIKGEEQIHRFDTVEAYKVKVEFLECEKEQNGYYEPIINSFKVYYCR